jgi:hypothetical protein
MEILLVRFFFVDAQTFGMLPCVAILARNAVGPVVDLTVCATNAVENPVVLLLFKLLQSLLVPLNFR